VRIAILGTRGIPANYGGFETFAEELSWRLAARGHDVTVYCRSNRYKHDRAPFYRGVRRRLLPTIPLKHTDTVVHGFLSAWHAAFGSYDAVYFCNTANGLWTLIPRLFGKRVVINVDGLEWERRKWGMLGRWWHRLGARMCTIFPHAIVTDARVIYDYYKKTFDAESYLIPYGAPTQRIETTETLERFGLKPRRYILYVSRFEPENNPDKVVRAFEQVKTDLRLVMVGDAPYAADFIREVKATHDPRILFTGCVYGPGYTELQSHAFSYVHATEVGGTHPALIEAMGLGNCVLVNSTPENLEVMGNAGVPFDAHRPEDLAAKLQHLVDHPEIAEDHRVQAVKRIKDYYNWDRVADLTEEMCKNLLEGRPRPGLRWVPDSKPRPVASFPPGEPTGSARAGPAKVVAKSGATGPALR
jgi:glycosyltransferase involved in cell wall biosynthesis